MPLDDFFAKREKKKTKKKQNPESLMRELVNDSKQTKSNESGGNLDSSIVSSILKDDEWETLDDGEKEIDLESIRIMKLSVGGPEESSKGTGNDPSDDGVGSTEDGKKVWGFKPAEPPAVEPEPEPPVVESKPATRAVYVPVHLRAGAAKGPKAAKPDVGSSSDFPTLDAAVAAPPMATPTPNTQTKVPAAPNEDDEGWEQAGITRKPIRLSENQPPVTPSKPSYVPPSRRQSSFPTSNLNLPIRLNNYPDDRLGSARPFNYDGSGSRPSGDLGTSGVGWSRGSTISGAAQDSVSPAPKTLTPSTRSGWERGSHTKTFRDMEQEKSEFQLAQSNRFAGLNGI